MIASIAAKNVSFFHYCFDNYLVIVVYKSFPAELVWQGNGVVFLFFVIPLFVA